MTDPAQPTTTFDHVYRGYHSEGGVCRVRVYRPEGGRPVLLLEELAENENTSVTNLVEHLVPEVLQRLGLSAAGEPLVVVEYYAGSPELPYDPLLGIDRYSLVTFSDWTWVPGRMYDGAGRPRWRIGQPDWRHVTAAVLRAELGIEPPETHTYRGRQAPAWGTTRGSCLSTET